MTEISQERRKALVALQNEIIIEVKILKETSKTRGRQE